MKDLDYEERLMYLNLPSLEFRRLRGDLIETYKIVHKIYDPKTTEKLFTLVPEQNTTRTNSLKLLKKRSNTEQYKYFFTNRVVNVWNKLPENIVNSETLNSFKNKIDSHFMEYVFSNHINVYYN